MTTCGPNRRVTVLLLCTRHDRTNRRNKRNDDERCNYDGALHIYGHEIRPRKERHSIHAH
jgi:hypothetical protein